MRLRWLAIPALAAMAVFTPAVLPAAQAAPAAAQPPRNDALTPGPAYSFESGKGAFLVGAPHTATLWTDLVGYQNGNIGYTFTAVGSGYFTMHPVSNSALCMEEANGFVYAESCPSPVPLAEKMYESGSNPDTYLVWPAAGPTYECAEDESAGSLNNETLTLGKCTGYPFHWWDRINYG